MPTTYQETFSQAPLSTILPAYVYGEFADDETVQAFFAAANNLTQQYLDWFLDTPLATYTNPAISGPILDWVGTNLYDTPRPVYSTFATSFKAGMNAFPMNTLAMNGKKASSSGSASLVSDDLYKRTLTWVTYKGDGLQMTMPWLKRRVARFIYGVNGADLSDIGLIQTIGLSVSGDAVTFQIPAGLSVSPYFQNLVDHGWLPLPFEQTFSVTTYQAIQVTLGSQAGISETLSLATPVTATLGSQSGIIATITN